jgi:hypothetical protein
MSVTLMQKSQHVLACAEALQWQERHRNMF